MIELYTDGGAQPNPGIGAYAYVIVEDGKVVASDSGIVGDNVTNNVCEYTAMLRGLDKIQELYKNRDFVDGEVSLISDSQLMINQITGKYRVNNELLKCYRRELVELAADIFGDVQVDVRWKGREDLMLQRCDGMCDVRINGRKLSITH